MKSRILLTAPAVVALAAAACTANVGPEATGTTAEGLTSSSSSASPPCPDGANDAQQRAAATAAYGIMKAAAAACAGNETGSIGGPCWGDAILNSQRYSIASGGASIVFNPSDALYRYVPAAAQAALAVAQLDASTAEFLVQGLEWAHANTNGQVAVVSLPTEALSAFSYPGSSARIAVDDGNAGNDRRTEVVTGSAWCNSEDIHFVDTSTYESGFAPFNVIPFTELSEPGGNAAGFTGGNSWPSTPFNGPGGGGNPYLVISLTENGSSVAVNWNSSSWPTENCSGSPECSGTIDIDPIPYTQPGTYYNAVGLVGPQPNPFTLVQSSLYADPSKAGTWATQIVAGVSHGGTFSKAISVLGLSLYEYVQQY